MPKDCEVIERPELEIPYSGKVFSSSGHIRNFVCDDGDLSPPLLKVVVTVTTTFSNWNLKFVVFFLLPKAFCGLKYAENAIAAGAPPRTPLGELTTLPQIQ